MLVSLLADQVPSLVSIPTAPVLAYLDPGSGSMMLQLLIAGLFSGAFFLKSSFGYVRDSFGRLAKRV